MEMYSRMIATIAAKGVVDVFIPDITRDIKTQRLPRDLGFHEFLNSLGDDGMDYGMEEKIREKVPVVGRSRHLF